MMVTNFWIFLFVSTSFSSAKNLQISLYYETLCPDSIGFIRQQLYPAFQGIQKYINLDLVPYGFASASNASGHWEFKCQHGPKECYNNKIHACVIADNSISSSMEFINCAMESRRKDPKLCANLTNIPWEDIKDCFSSGRADTLLIENGKKTNSVTPRITFVPTIIFNGVYNEEMQNEAERNLLKLVCQLLKNKPDICKKLGYTYNMIV